MNGVMKTEETVLQQSIFQIDISNTFGPEYVEMFNDIARFMMIQIGIQVMLVMSDPVKYSFYTGEFIVLLFFIVIGVLFYWLILRKLIHFT